MPLLGEVDVTFLVVVVLVVDVVFVVVVFVVDVVVVVVAVVEVVVVVDVVVVTDVILGVVMVNLGVDTVTLLIVGKVTGDTVVVAGVGWRVLRYQAMPPSTAIIIMIIAANEAAREMALRVAFNMPHHICS